MAVVVVVVGVAAVMVLVVAAMVVVVMAAAVTVVPMIRVGLGNLGRAVEQRALHDRDQRVDAARGMLGFRLQFLVPPAQFGEVADRRVALGDQALPVLAGLLEAAGHRLYDGVDAGESRIQPGLRGVVRVVLVAHGLGSFLGYRVAVAVD